LRSLGDGSVFSSGFIWGGVLLALSMQLSLYFLTEVQLADSILLALLLVGMPALAIAQLPLIKEAFIERVPAYWSSIGTLCALGVITCLVGMRREGPRAIGLEWISTDRLVIWTLVLTVAGLVVSFAFRNIGISLGLKESRMLRALLPETGKERGIFVLLSVAAGLGEEIAYRGYAIPVLTPVTGVAGAVLITSLVFGVMHAYQSALGIVRTMTMGVILAWGFLMSGSLLPCILAHTFIDIIAGIAIAQQLMLPEESIGEHEFARPEP